MEDSFSVAFAMSHTLVILLVGILLAMLFFFLGKVYPSR